MKSVDSSLLRSSFVFNEFQNRIRRDQRTKGKVSFFVMNLGTKFRREKVLKRIERVLTILRIGIFFISCNACLFNESTLCRIRRKYETARKGSFFDVINVSFDARTSKQRHACIKIFRVKLGTSVQVASLMSFRIEFIVNGRESVLTIPCIRISLTSLEQNSWKTEGKRYPFFDVIKT